MKQNYTTFAGEEEAVEKEETEVTVIGGNNEAVKVVWGGRGVEREEGTVSDGREDVETEDKAEDDDVEKEEEEEESDDGRWWLLL